MLRQQLQREEPREEPEDGGGVLRKGLPFAVAFAVGFLLGKQREDGAKAVESRDQPSEAASEVRERATPGETETESATSETAGARGETESAAQAETAEPETESGGEQSEAEESETEGSQAEAESEPEGAQPAGTEAAGIDEEVARLSPPTAHGMPMLGLGTYQMEEYDECVEAVRHALQMGYSHVDTAEGYDNEAAVGDAIVEAEINRDDVFLATKVSPDNLDYDHVLTSAADSFERLGVDFVDLLYAHWPTGEYEATDTLEAFAELREEGLIGEIGVSNFTVDLLEEAIEVSEEPIFANQVEMHPLLQQTELQQFCAQDDVDVELVAYSPIARGDVSDVEELQEVAEKHDATPQQISLAWLREKEVTAIPKATSEEHLRENWLSLGVELDDEDVEKIDDIDEERRIVDPDQAPWNQ
jgi:2,5-diketo-D-gluconate reductase B